MLLNAPPSGAEPNANLKACRACGKPMAKSARSCPHCGKTYTTVGGIFVAIIIGLILAGGFFVFR